MRTIASVIAAVLLTIPLAFAQRAESPKFSDRALGALASQAGDFPMIFWVFLGADAIADEPIAMTVKALARRGKVDSTGFLIDSHDYPISDQALSEIENTGVFIRHASRWLRAVSVYADSSQMGKLAALPFVERIDLVRTLKTGFMEDVAKTPRHIAPLSAEEYAYGESLLQNQFIETDRLHRLGLTGTGVMIAIFDTGFDVDHPALDSVSVIATYDFINLDTDVNGMDCPENSERNHQNYHGTAVWSVIAGNMPDTLIGIAPGADYILAKTEITCDGTEIKLEEDNWIAAAEWADSIGADIITSSLGYYVFSDTGSYAFDELNGDSALITIAADMAASRNILVITSAGNERNNAQWPHISLPADGDSVLAIGAVRADSTLAWFSSPGPTADGRIKPDVSTLGVGVYAARSATGSYTYLSGTSFSAPLVAGGAALAMEHDPARTARHLFDMILSTASRYATPDNDFGYGLFSAFRAADVLRLNPIGVVQVQVGQEVEVIITTSGGTEIIPLLTAFDLPVGVELEDLGDGTGLLSVTGSELNPLQARFGLIADFGQTVDTTYAILETYGSSDDAIFAGPNPFADSVRVFLSPAAGEFRSVSVFNSAGEKVWEQVNHFGPSADVTREWGMVHWDGHNRSGAAVAAGVYLMYVETSRRTAMLKLLKTD
ncbi:MAG: S8 family peptidase [candidate division Zixibacteria bacterium]|nr:S8 family peptidase [candidate division Zixibacteria bacterium]